MADDKQELAPLPPPAPTSGPSDAATLANVMGTDRAAYYSSIDTSTNEGKIALFKAAQAADFEVGAKIGQRIMLQHVYASPAEKFDEKTGEIVPLTRIVLIDADGTSYECFSKGIRKVVGLIVGMYKLPPWNPPIHVELVKEKLGNGNQWFTLHPVFDAPAPKGKK